MPKLENIIRGIKFYTLERLIPSSSTGANFFTGHEPTVTYTSSTVVGHYTTQATERYIEMGIMDIHDKLFTTDVDMNLTDILRSGTVDYSIKDKLTTDFKAYTGYTYILQEVK